MVSMVVGSFPWSAGFSAGVDTGLALSGRLGDGGGVGENMSKPACNFARLDPSRPDAATLITAMLAARQAVERRSWASPFESTDDYWWTDVLADPAHAVGGGRRSVANLQISAPMTRLPMSRNLQSRWPARNAHGRPSSAEQT